MLRWISIGTLGPKPTIHLHIQNMSPCVADLAQCSSSGSFRKDSRATAKARESMVIKPNSLAEVWFVLGLCSGLFFQEPTHNGLRV